MGVATLAFTDFGMRNNVIVPMLNQLGITLSSIWVTGQCRRPTWRKSPAGGSCRFLHTG